MADNPTEKTRPSRWVTHHWRRGTMRFPAGSSPQATRGAATTNGMHAPRIALVPRPPTSLAWRRSARSEPTQGEPNGNRPTTRRAAVPNRRTHAGAATARGRAGSPHPQPARRGTQRPYPFAFHCYLLRHSHGGRHRPGGHRDSAAPGHRRAGRHGPRPTKP